jgi:hypothetical protein
MHRNALLAETFGAKVGIEMANLIKNGVVSMEELANSATGIFSDETIAQAELFNDTMNRLKRQILVPLQAAFISLSMSVLDTFEALGLVTAEEKGLTLVTHDLKKLNEELIKENRFIANGMTNRKNNAKAIKDEILLLEEKQKNF